jgi:AraC-like DNA-binding protein
MCPDEIKLLSAHYFKSYDAHQRVACRRHDPMDEIIVMLGGVYRSRQLGDTPQAPVEARAGDVIYWPAGADRVEESDPRDPMHCIAIYLVWSHPPILQPALVHDNEGVIRILANRLLALRTLPLPLPTTVPNHFAAAITAELLYLLSRRVDTLLGRVARYVETHMSRPFTLAELAREVGLQRHHLGRRFKSLTGLTPMEYVRRRKADHALNSFLADANQSATEIAAAVGVKDTYQLRRLLKRCYGLTVREIRRKKPGGVAGKAPSAASPWMSSITASLLDPEAGSVRRRRRSAVKPK